MAGRAYRPGRSREDTDPEEYGAAGGREPEEEPSGESEEWQTVSHRRKTTTREPRAAKAPSVSSRRDDRGQAASTSRRDHGYEGEDGPDDP